MPHIRVNAAAVLVALTFTLAGCAASGETVDSEYPDLTLAETKSPTQLLRNEAASRVPTDLVASVGAVVDQSQGCLFADTDPEGHIRRWTSGVVITLNEGVDARTVADDLSHLFATDEWSETRFDYGPGMELTNTDSLAVIRVLPQHFTDGEPDTLRVEGLGPCVRTDGAESDEVTQLESFGS